MRLLISYIHMPLILFIGLCVIKYQIIAHFRGWVGAYSRGRSSINLVSRVGTYSRLGAYSRARGRLIKALRYVITKVDQRRYLTLKYQIQILYFPFAKTIESALIHVL